MWQGGDYFDWIDQSKWLRILIVDGKEVKHPALLRGRLLIFNKI